MSNDSRSLQLLGASGHLSPDTLAATSLCKLHFLAEETGCVGIASPSEEHRRRLADEGDGSAGTTISASSTAGDKTGVLGVEQVDMVAEGVPAEVITTLSLEPLLLLVSEPVLALLFRVRFRLRRCARGALVTDESWKPSFDAM